MADIAPPPPTRRAPSAPTHSNSPSTSLNASNAANNASQPFKPPHLRLDSNSSSSSSASPPLTQSASSPHNLSNFSPRNSPLGRRSNIRLSSPRHSVLSPSHSLPSLQAAAQLDDAVRHQLGRSSSNNRLSAIISKKAGISPIVTYGIPPTVSGDGYNSSIGNVEVKQEAVGSESASTAASALASASPPFRPSPLERPSSISLSLPQPKAALVAASSNSSNGALHVDEEEAPSLTINHSLGAAVHGQFLQQPSLQPLSSASSLSSSSPLPPLDPVTPITPFTPTGSQPIVPPSPIAASVDSAYKDQLDGVLRKRGDSHLNLQALDPNIGLLAVPLPLQMRQMSAMGPERRVAFRVDRADGLDLVDIIPEEDDEGAETKLTRGWQASMRASRGILKTVNIKGTEEERRRRSARAAEREKEWIRFVQDGSTLIKYNAQGKPQKRWVYVSEDGHEMAWEKPTDQWTRPKKRWDEDDDERKDDHKHSKHPPPSKPITSRSAGDIHVGSSSHTALKPPSPRPLHQNSAPALHAGDSSHSTEQPSTPNTTVSARAKRRSSLPSMRILNWKINPDRTRYLADVLGVHYGPYHSATRFNRFLQRKDYQVAHTTFACHRLLLWQWSGGSHACAPVGTAVLLRVVLQTGFPWLAFSIEFPDRTLDLVGGREDEVQQWFLGVQALAPLSVHHLTMGGVLWQRLIMKLNFYGLVSTLPL